MKTKITAQYLEELVRDIDVCSPRAIRLFCEELSKRLEGVEASQPEVGEGRELCDRENAEG